MTDPKVLQQCRNLGKDVFSEMGPDSEDGLFEFLKGKCEGWRSSLTNYKALADTGTYPGQEEINDGLSLIKALLAADGPAKFIERFMENKAALLDLSEAFHDIDNFYRHQKPTWEKLRKAFDRFGLNRMELERDQAAFTALARMKEILSAPSPYDLVHEAEGLISTVESINTAIVAKRREEALTKANSLRDQLFVEATKAVVGELPFGTSTVRELATEEDRFVKSCLKPLDDLIHAIDQQESVAHIGQALQEAERALDSALAKIDEYLKKKHEKAGDGEPKPVVKPRKEIKPAALVKSPYLETQDDIEGFLDALRRELQDALARGERIQIR
jgi:hypothetical protein